MELDLATAIARFVHEAALLLLLGGILFRFRSGHTKEPARARHRSVAVLAWTALLSALSWLIAYVADVSGEPLSARVLRDFLLETDLGLVWSLRIAGLVALAALATWPLAASFARWPTFISALSGAQLVGLAWLGHAASGVGAERTAGLVSHGCHVLAAAAWLGGLVPLLQCLRRPTAEADSAHVQAVLESFSRIGIAAVGTIAATGMVNAYLRSVTIDSLLATAYGRVLALKIMVFAVLVGLAACNRWVFLRQLKAGHPPRGPVAALARSVVAEMVLGAVVVALAVVLALSSPTG